MCMKFITAALTVCLVGIGATPVHAQSSQLFGNPDALSMQIDLLPGQEQNVIKKRSGRVVPVAILGSDSLDTGKINPRTIRLEGIGVMLVGKSDKSLCKQLDINNDGHLDLLCEVRTTGFRVDEGEYRILLKAETWDKGTLLGEDRLKIQQ